MDLKKKLLQFVSATLIYFYRRIPVEQKKWLTEGLHWYHRFVIRVLQAGPIPRHIGIIMDGNRRFAVKSKLPQKEGHIRGFQKLMETLTWCQEIGIREVTVYAFSIENFKRTKEEVEALKQLARERFSSMLAEMDNFNERGICIRMIGNVSLLPTDLLPLLAKSTLLTRNNRKLILNMAVAYTSRDEIAHSVRTVASGLSDGSLTPEDSTEQLLTRCLYTRESPELDLLLRTSGDTRLSDFMSWQSTTAVLYFVQELQWPAITIWHLLLSVLYYQRHCHPMAQVQRSMLVPKVHDQRPTVDSLKRDQRLANFLERIDRQKWESMELAASA